MRPSSNILATLVLLTLGVGGCVEPYAPEVVSTNANLLVVDGFINGNGRTRIRLSRTENIAATTMPPAERGARILIQDDTGQRYTLQEQSAGFYLSDSLLLPVGRRYQLRITTATNADYASDLMALKVTPPIAKLDYQLADDNVTISLDTHDASGQSRYYRWSYAETWEFNMPYTSKLEYKNGDIVPRTTPIYTCWRTERPSTIMQSSTAGLSADIVSNQLLLHPSARSDRFKIRYSVLVSQYAESAEEFAYNEILRKNTEAVGTVNDPLPSQLVGNVHRVNAPAESAFGFVGVRTVQSRRIFINRQDLPSRAADYFDNPFASCQEPDTAEILAPYRKGSPHYPQSQVCADPAIVPTDLIYTSSTKDPIYGYYGGSADCIDCRTRGSNVKPAYW